jgi:hypothetical protein
MSIVVYVVVAVIIGAIGYGYYEHQQNTLLEVDAGSHSLSLQKN